MEFETFYRGLLKNEPTLTESEAQQRFEKPKE